MDEHEQFPALKVSTSIAERAQRAAQASRRNSTSLAYGAVAGLIATSVAVFWLVGWQGVLETVKIVSIGAVIGAALGGYCCLKNGRFFLQSRSPGLAMFLTCAVFSGLALSVVLVIDEVQRRPDLFPLLRVLADRKPLPARFLILGSASPELLRQSSETLAGRLETVPLEGFRMADVGADSQTRHWLRGGFPLSFTANRQS